MKLGNKSILKRIILAQTILIVFLLSPILLHAYVRLPALVGNHMALQRNTKVNIWVWASLHESVKINAEWLNSDVIVVTKSDSTWLAQIKTPDAGNDGNFFPAKAEIVRNKILIYSSSVVNPKMVRFAWDEEAQPNQTNY